MATDGQGVVLAVPQSVDSRQRTALDLLARRVGHRMGRPVAIGHVQRATLLGGAPLRALHSKGAREVVVVPLSLGPLRMSTTIELGGPETAALARTMGVVFADPIGPDPAVIDGVREMLTRSEREPHPGTTLELVLAGRDGSAADGLRESLPGLVADGWKNAEVRVLDTTGTAPAPPPEPGSGQVLVVGMAITPGPFLDRVADHARRTRAQLLPATLHSTESLTRTICTRISSSRRR